MFAQDSGGREVQHLETSIWQNLQETRQDHKGPDSPLAGGTNPPSASPHPETYCHLTMATGF